MTTKRDPESAEKRWWRHRDTLEPVMGVPGVAAAVAPAPLPDTATDEPEPGIAPAQEVRVPDDDELSEPDFEDRER